MGKVLGILFLLFIVIFAFIMFPNITSSIHQADSSVYTDTFTNITTTAGVYTAALNLTEPLYNASLPEVTSVKSDNTNDLPSLASYDSTKQQLTVKSLEGGASRNLTLNYYTQYTYGFVGFHQFLGPVPLLMFAGILGIFGLGIWWTFFKGK